MTTLNVNTIKPAGATLNLGESGDSVVLADDVKVNLVKDAGANTLWSSNGSGVLSSVRAGIGGVMKLLSTQTVTNTANVDFTSGIDSTYKEYVFKFIDINPATDNVQFQFQVNASGQSGFNETTTTTYFVAYHSEDGTQSALTYAPSLDQAQGTSFQDLMHNLGNDADACGAGELHLFNPASTTYVKNFHSTVTGYDEGNTTPGREWAGYIGGYFNITAAIDEVSFKMS